MTFRLFLKMDKKKSGVLNLFGGHNQVESSLQQIQTSLDKVDEFHLFLVYNLNNPLYLNLFLSIISLVFFNFRRRLNWRNWVERRNGGRGNPGLRRQRKWSCCSASLILRSCQGSYGWWGLARSSCSGVKRRWASLTSLRASFKEMPLQSFSLVRDSRVWSSFSYRYEDV